MNTQLVVQNFLHSRHARNLSLKTIEWYEAELRRFAHSYPELPTEPEPIEEFLADLKYSNETKHGYYRALKTFFRFVSQRYGVPNPMQQVAPPRCPKKLMPTLEPHEMMLLLTLVNNPRDKALLTLLIDTGARVGEVAGLRRQDVKESSIRVCGKTGEREIPISDETRGQLLGLMAANDKSDYLFMGTQGPLTRSGIYRIVRTHMRRAGIDGPKLGPHRIRHAFGKSYLVAGGDMRSLQQIMGHANITTTEKYASLNLNDTIVKHHKFTPLRAAHAAAQGSFFDTSQAIREAEVVLMEARGEKS